MVCGLATRTPTQSYADTLRPLSKRRGCLQQVHVLNATHMHLDMNRQEGYNESHVRHFSQTKRNGGTFMAKFFRVEQTTTRTFFVEAKDRDEAEYMTHSLYDEGWVLDRLEEITFGETDIQDYPDTPNEDVYWIVYSTEDGESLDIR